jgi:hypothetical protein
LRPDHARFVSLLGRLLADQGRYPEALDHCQKARKQQEMALAKTPADRALRHDLLTTRETLARVRFLKGDIGREDYIAQQRQLLRERQDNAGSGPGAAYFQAEVSSSAAVLAWLLLESGRTQEALAVVAAVLPAHQRLVHAEQQRWQNELRWKPIASLKFQQFCFELEELLQQAKASDLDMDVFPAFSPKAVFRRPLVPPSCRLWQQEAELLALKGAALARTGQAREALDATREAIARAEQAVRGEACVFCPPWSWSSAWPVIAAELFRQNPEPCHLYDLACHLALASTLSGPPGGNATADRAVQALRHHVASGFDNVHKLRSDPRLEPLRKREDFGKLVHDLAARSPGRKDASQNP